MAISRNLKPFAAFFAALWVNSPAAAAPLTWEETVREAARQNPDLAAERAGVAAAEAQYRGALSPFFPTINGNLDVSRSDSETTTPGTSYDSSLTGRYNLFNGLADTAVRAQSRADLVEARARYESVSADVGQQLKNAFARLLFAQDQLLLSQSIANRRRENLRLVQLRYEGGRENKGSYLRTKADYNASLYDVNQSSRALHASQRELGRAMGRSRYDTLVATGSFQTASILSQPFPDFESLARQTPEYRQSEAQAQSARYGVTVARSGFSPSLEANASGGRSSSTWPPDRDRWSVGASVSIPIFSGWSTIQDVERAKADRARALFNRESTAQLIARQLEDAYAAFANATENVSAQVEYEEAAQVRAQIARGQYANGLVSFFDWDGIENELIQRQRSRLAAWRDALLAEAAWQNTQGVGLAADEFIAASPVERE